MLDLLTLTATEARELFDKGELTSVELVEAYLAQIEKHNHQGLKLNALISLVPREKLLATARQLDSERKAGRVRGPLHGIPFVFKDVFTTHPDLELPCTGGSPCFKSAKARRTAPVIQHLIDQGMIILGTANLSEFCGLKYDGLTVGFSPMGGQTQSPYVKGGLEKGELILGNSQAGGSSAGSGVAVAAGFAPLSIGTECCGSLITPANRSALYSLKCSLDAVDVRGNFHFSTITDYIGGMAKTPKDLAPFIAGLMQKPKPFDISGGFKGLKVGFLDPENWLLGHGMCNYEDHGVKDHMIKAYNESKKKIAGAGAEVIDDAGLKTPGDRFKHDGKSLFYEITFYQLKNKTFPEFFNEFETSEVRSIKDMIKWNVDHSDLCLPKDQKYQTQFYDLLRDNTDEEEWQVMVDELRALGKELDDVLDTVDVVVTFAESSLAQYTSALGGPSATAPLGLVPYSDTNSRPFGLIFAAKKGHEELLLRVLAAFEELYPNRPLPQPLMDS